ncbi:hypothetical protein ACP275_14G061300 [Erythranthe tilingii]
MKSTDKSILRNPSSMKTKLALRFLRSMKKLMMNKNNNTTYSCRYRAIRAAAYASMASVVGPNKAWSRALIGKRRERKNRVVRRGRKLVLRELVPGGEGMDICRLLSETGDYIKCLIAQVQLMRKIVDNYSSRL